MLNSKQNDLYCNCKHFSVNVVWADKEVHKNILLSIYTLSQDHKLVKNVYFQYILSNPSRAANQNSTKSCSFDSETKMPYYRQIFLGSIMRDEDNSYREQEFDR